MNKKLNPKIVNLSPVLYLWLVFAFVACLALLSPFFGIETVAEVITKLFAPFGSLVLMTVGSIFLYFSQKTFSKIAAIALAVLYINGILEYLVINKVFDVFSIASIVILVYNLAIVLVSIMPKYANPINPPAPAKEPQ